MYARWQNFDDPKYGEITCPTGRGCNILSLYINATSNLPSVPNSRTRSSMKIKKYEGRGEESVLIVFPSQYRVYCCSCQVKLNKSRLIFYFSILEITLMCFIFKLFKIRVSVKYY